MKYFTISEMLYSPTAVKRGIWNGCDRTQEDNLVALVDNVLDPARQKYGKAVHVSSGYRCPQLNTLIHGALGSQHLLGEAADLTTDVGPQGNLELARLIITNGKFDQLILENVSGSSLLPAWVHVSWKRNGGNRGEIRKKVAGSSQYPLLTAEELSEVGSLKSDVGCLRSDVGSLRSEVGCLRSDVRGLKSDVGSLRSDVGSLRSDVRSLKSDVRNTSALRHQTSAIGKEVLGL